MMSGEPSHISLGQACGAAWALCHREIVRFLRQRNRIVGAIGQPILFWLLFGTGLGSVFRFPAISEGSQSFTVYFFPGTLLLIVLFTAIFATISIIEDRKEGFLQSVLVSPTPRWAMVCGKVLGGTLLAVGQGALFLILAPLIGISLGVGQVFMVILLLVVTAIGLTSLGFVLAWRMDSTQGFHAIMNLLLMPMWLLSGAFFPIPAARPGMPIGELVMGWVMTLNPVTYALAAIRRIIHFEAVPAAALEAGTEPLQFWLPDFATSCIVTLLFSVTMLVIASRMAQRTTRGDWQ